MSSTIDKILALARQLYPTGRVFKMPEGSDLETLHKAIGETQADAYNDAVSVLDSIIPDNPNFTADDAADAERRLGLITNPAVPLPDRIKAIIRKMNAPGKNPAKGNYLYLEGQLRAAGFDVYVHENIPEQNPLNVVVKDGFGQIGQHQFNEVQFGNVDLLYTVPIQLGYAQFGQFQFGDVMFINKIVNHIDEEQDLSFVIAPNYRSLIFIGGQIKGSFASVDVKRKNEFRQLILRLKQDQTVGYLFINYI